MNSGEVSQTSRRNATNGIVAVRQELETPLLRPLPVWITERERYQRLTNFVVGSVPEDA